MIKNENDAAGYFKRKEVNSQMYFTKDGVECKLYPDEVKQSLPEGHNERVQAFRHKVQGKVAFYQNKRKENVVE
jgi:hypothetical protein